MYFAKDEIIELNNGEKYIVLDTAIIDNETYYKIQKINPEETKVEEDVKYISAKNIEGKIYINENITEDMIDKLTELLS